MKKGARPVRRKAATKILKSIEAVLAYAKRGWRLLPLKGKVPALKNWPTLATTDETTITAWWNRTPRPNFGIATGKASNVVVLDVDPRHGGDAALLALEVEFGDLPHTVKVITGGGGHHYYFLYPTVAIGNSSGKLGSGLDIRSDSGQVVAPPSLHPETGRVYQWAPGHHPDHVSLAPIPLWMLNKLTPADEPKRRGRPRKDDVQRRHYSHAEVTDMLDVIPADDRDLWRHVGIILGREFKCSDEAFALYTDWSEKWDGVKAPNHDAVMREAFYELSQQAADRELSLGTIVREAVVHGWAPKSGCVPIEDFIFYAPEGDFLYRPTLDSWGAGSVNIVVSPLNIDGQMVKASDLLKKTRCVTSLACDPIIDGEFEHGKNCVNGELIPSEGGAVFNTYRRPTIELGDATKAGPWREHNHLLFNKPGDADQFMNYMAHRAQHPGEKPRFAELIGGEQGVGKDTAIEMCVPAFGVWNVSNIAPSTLSSQFNEHASATLIRISETANQKELSRFVLNELLKVLIAGSPDFCVVNPKYGHKFTVRLHCGVIITTNHLLSGIYIPQDDRRYDVIECATKAEMGLEDDAKRRVYFEQLWKWFYEDDGARHIAAYLHARDLTGFSASQGQRKTAAHKMIIQNSLSGDEWFIDALEALGNPTLFRGDALLLEAMKNLEDPDEVRGKLSFAAERHGFAKFQSPLQDGRWISHDTKKRCALFLKLGAPTPTKREREMVLGSTHEKPPRKF